MSTTVAYRASVLLAVRDRARLLLRCLSTVARLGDDAGFEAVVFDDGSRDETAAVLAGIDGDFRALGDSHGIGWGLAIDRAAAVARGEHLVLLREDAVPVDGWLDALLDALHADPGLGVALARAARLDGSVVRGEWACAAVRRAAFTDVGGFAGSSEVGRAEKATLLEAIGRAGWGVAEIPAATVLIVPERVEA